MYSSSKNFSRYAICLYSRWAQDWTLRYYATAKMDLRSVEIGASL